MATRGLSRQDGHGFCRSEFYGCLVIKGLRFWCGLIGAGRGDVGHLPCPYGFLPAQE